MGLDLQHSCDGEMASTSGLSPQAACAEFAGLSWTGIVIAIVIIAGLAVLGWLLWRRIRDRGDME